MDNRFQIEQDELEKLIKRALEEDFGENGDITSRSTIPADLRGKATLLAKENLVIVGIPVAEEVFKAVDQQLKPDWKCSDGDKLQAGQLIGCISGRMRSILEAERTALNFLQRLSGIATLTYSFVKAVEGTQTQILDTRKTTPTLRALEKYAVKKGGGKNHRFGLFDMVMIKDNHIDAAGGLDKAVASCLNYMKESGETLAIEVETRSIAEVEQALNFPIQRIMLDNMNISTMKKAVKIINGKVETEASGNVTLERAREIAETGVDFISIGALTHSVKAADISLLHSSGQS